MRSAHGKNMKTFYVICTIYVVSIVRGVTGTLTFDDLPTGGGYLPVPNGYGGLNWSNFLVLDGPADGDGYKVGTISPNNVIFDSYALPAAISSTSLFSLSSGYFTAGLELGLNLEVQGFHGATLLYDATYTLTDTNAMFIDFNFSGIDRVLFTPYLDGSAGSSSQFVIDNLTVGPVPEPGTAVMVVLGVFLMLSHRLRCRPNQRQGACT